MYSLTTLILFVLIALVIGLTLGLVLHRLSGSEVSRRQLEEHLREMQSRQKDYQNNVTEHFVQTAHLLDQLTTTYREVHNHLAQGAQTLCGESAGKVLSALPDAMSGKRPEYIDPARVQPPLDYAPRAPYEKGALDETYGLEKSTQRNTAFVTDADELDIPADSR